MVDSNLIIALIAIVISVTISLIASIWKLFKHFDDKYDRKFDLIRIDISEMQKKVVEQNVKLNIWVGGIEKFEKEFRTQMTDIYKMAGPMKKYTGNPVSPEEKKELIEKYKNGLITIKEGEKLKRVLEEEKSEAEEKGNVFAVIAIGLLLAGLAYLIYKLMSEE